MPAADLVQTVRAAIEKNKEIPAVLDAYGEFVDSPIGPLELQNLEAVFSRILDNLAQRYPDIASKRAANTARNDIASFLLLANNTADRVKDVLRSELRAANKTMTASIAERFTRMSTEERRAVDATLRLVRRSTVELLFRVDAGKQMASAGREFERYFSSIKAESPTMRELRYENLIVEKAIFNKLLLKSKEGDYTIWVPSFFAKENVDALISRLALPTEHLLLSRLKEMRAQGRLDQARPFLSQLFESLGVMPKSAKVPEDLADFVQEVGEYRVMSPIELDDVSLLLKEEEGERLAKQRAEEERARAEEELHREEERKATLLRQMKRPPAVQVPVSEIPTAEKAKESILVGKQLDLDQLLSAINRRVQEKDLPGQVKTTGDYYVELATVKKSGVAIVGSSGSGRSTTLRRLLDGIGGKSSAPRVFVMDQKGEHRGIAWKYNWQVFAFVADSQAKEFRLGLFSESDKAESPELVADLLQEWCLQGGLGCSDQQRARIASIVRAQSEASGTVGLGAIADLMSKESELAQLGQKISKNLVSKSTFAKIFSEQQAGLRVEGSALFDISGRGLRDPTTKEERQMISVLALRDLSNSGTRDSVIVLEDILDRFKSESLRRRALELVSKLKANGNSIIATSRAQVRDFVGAGCLEILHRLSGEKVVNEELAGFVSNVPTRTLQGAISYLQRGYAFTSKVTEASGSTLQTAAIRVEPLQFAASQP